MPLSSIVYQLVRWLLGLIAVLVRKDLSKDAELLMLRHENAVLHRQAARVPSTPGRPGLGWRPYPGYYRTAAGRRFPGPPTTILAWHRRLAARK